MDANLHAEMKIYCNRFQLERVENRLGNPGFPDTVALHRKSGMIALVELKELFERENEHVSFNMKKGQPVWHFEWARNGGRSFVFGKSKSGLYVLTRSRATMDWVQAITFSFPLESDFVYHWKSPNMDWGEFQEFLIA